MNTLTDQLKQMENDRKKLVKRIESATTDFEREQAIQDLKAHDIEVGKLLGLK